MAPERFEGRSDPRSDIYGLGLTLYEMLTLRPAFAASDRARLVERVQHEEPPGPASSTRNSPRPGDHRPEGHRQGAGPALRDGDGDGRGPATLPGDRPIEARRVATWEQVWRWCHRNPGLAVSTATAAILLVVIAVGSVASAARLGTELRRTTDAQRAERDAKKDALDKLWRSQLARAQAGRFSRRPGQRLDSLAALKEAAQIAREVGVSAGALDELRNEAIACLALPDLRPGTSSVGVPPGTSAIAFDDSYQLYALSDAKGTISVYRFGDDEPVVRLPGLGRAAEALVFSPDGRLVAGWSSGELQVWVADGGQAVFPKPLPARYARSVQRRW